MNIRLTVTGAAVALTLAACATGPQYGGGYGNGYGDRSGYGSQQQACGNCGIVTRIDTVASGRTAPTAAGAVLASSYTQLDKATRVLPLGVAMGLVVILMNAIDNIWLAVPFLILLGLSLACVTIGTVAAAAALRQAE